LWLWGNGQLHPYKNGGYFSDFGLNIKYIIDGYPQDLWITIGKSGFKQG
jgi:hypothetical protein